MQCWTSCERNGSGHGQLPPVASSLQESQTSPLYVHCCSQAVGTWNSSHLKTTHHYVKHYHTDSMKWLRWESRSGISSSPLLKSCSFFFHTVSLVEYSGISKHILSVIQSGKQQQQHHGFLLSPGCVKAAQSIQFRLVLIPFRSVPFRRSVE